jgi:hypothetical protein
VYHIHIKLIRMTHSHCKFSFLLNIIKKTIYKVGKTSIYSYFSLELFRAFSRISKLEIKLIKNYEI